jgi:hypothetical protein
VPELFTPVHFLILIVIAVFVVVPFWQIFKKAGFPPAFALLMLVPLVSIIMLYVLAFLPWKVASATIPPDRRDT